MLIDQSFALFYCFLIFLSDMPFMGGLGIGLGLGSGAMRAQQY
jgi:hypothetical protein